MNRVDRPDRAATPAVVTLACVHLPALPLQIAQRRHPHWRGLPVVVEEDRPHSPVLWVNEQARQAGVLPGLRYSVALGLAGNLRAATVSASQIADAVSDLATRLRQFSPEVEPAEDDPGIFWVGLVGLDRLYGSPANWAAVVRSDLKEAGFAAAVVVGFTRFGTCAMARVCRGIRVFRAPEEEKAAALGVRLDRLDIDPDFRDALRALGVRTVGALLRLPAEGLLERFGPQAYRLHRMAAGELWTPLRPSREIEPVRRRVILDAPETESTRLLFVIKGLVHPMLAALAARGEALAELILRLLLDRAGWREDHIRPAAPTLEVVQILDLVRLRLEAAQIGAGRETGTGRKSGARWESAAEREAGAGRAGGITEIDLVAVGTPATPEQIRFFVEHPRRDPAAANRAIARLRAEFGEEAVVRARLRSGHLPEARFAWEPVRALAPANSRQPTPRDPGGEPHPPTPAGAFGDPEGETPGPVRPLVRRILSGPVPLLPPPRALHDDGWLALGLEHGAVDEIIGPYIVSGGWWVREVHREYHFVETRRGDLLWVYYDRRRRRWFLCGRVE
ncbi:MAG: DNA polymerase Y family protein [Armatimonadetes bacterium]|nr:DNA polymerase Y family protein [Armatimonadota bacterium]